MSGLLAKRSVIMICDFADYNSNVKDGKKPRRG